MKQLFPREPEDFSLSLMRTLGAPFMRLERVSYISEIGLYFPNLNLFAVMPIFK